MESFEKISPYSEYRKVCMPWLDEIRRDILVLNKETEGLLDEILGV